MAEQTFRSPGFFDQEIDATTQVQAPSGIPAAIIGSAQRGPAFVPVTVGSFADFRTKFGDLESERFGPYAVNEWLKNKQSATFVRVLGGGANTTTSDITTTRAQDTVRNAGFKLTSTKDVKTDSITGSLGSVQFIVANHQITSEEALAYPQFTDNSSINDKSGLINTNLVRAVVFLASGTRLLCLDNNGNYSRLGSANGGSSRFQGDVATVGAVKSGDASKYFKLVISSTLSAFGTAEGYNSIRILTASLDPRDQSYIGKVLNTNPFKFGEEQHLLYADFSLEHELAPVASQQYATVAIVSGSGGTSSTSGDPALSFLDMFGRFDTRYKTARTTNFISQPYGDKEYDLFRFETLDDGEAGNNNYKISIANLRASTDSATQYGTFEVQVRGLYDLDVNPQIFERYPNCNLDPNSQNYVARIIGDRKVFFDFDQTSANERGVKIAGSYPNQSKLVRIVMSDDVTSGEAPATALPFGFRGIPTLKTNSTLTDNSLTPLTNNGRVLGNTGVRLTYSSGSLLEAVSVLTASIVPPIPYRIKITRGKTSTSGFLGFPGDNERTDGRYYWGINTVRIPVSTSVDPNGQTNTLLMPNDGSDFNTIINSYSKFVGISKLDALITGTAADAFNDNKFTLARVATSQTGNDLTGIFSSLNFTGTVDQIMRETVYVRNGNPVSPVYTLDPDGLLANRYTFASLLATSSVMFNRFSAYAKFTNIFYGGFDGLDITDKDRVFFRDRAVSTDAGGKAIASYSGPLGSPSNVGGEGTFNNNVASLNTAVGIVTSPLTSNANILAIPGIRDTYVTNNALNAVRDNGLMLYVLDSIKYDKNDNRVYDDSSVKSDPQNTAEQFASRNIDNSFAATFFPDVSINDNDNSKIVKVPSSVAALGVFGFSDQRSAPWFAPAGFDRGSLDFVTNVETRLSQDERDQLYDARINPIASFPTGGFVVFGQKTLQQAKSALDRINVRRMLIEVKRRVKDVAQNLIFEPNNAQTRARLVSGIVPQLTLIQTQQGIESFNVICDGTNNSQVDVDNYKMNCRIVIVPTRTIEFISVDFIITNSGVQFI